MGTAELWQEWDKSPDINIIATGPYGKANGVTKPDGSFILDGLGNGTYRLDFTKEGYGTIKLYGLQLFGGDTISLATFHIFKKYDTFVLPAFTKISVEVSAYPRVVIETDRIFEGSFQMPVVVFLDSKKNVSYNSLPCRTLSPMGWDQGRISLVFDTDQLPFESGTTVYLIAYVGNPAEIVNGYTDSFLGVEEYSTLIPEKHSQVLSFIMP
jgi:hypothetical protein